MNKCITLFLIGITTLPIHSNYAEIRLVEPSIDNNLITITQKTEFINRRYYYVTRLEKTIKLLNRIKQQRSSFFMHAKSIDINHLLDFNDVPEFKHHRIRNSIERMKQNKNLRPLYEVWDEFAAYKYLEDELFIDEFTKEIFVISRNLLLQVMPHTTKRHSTIKDLLHYEGVSSTTHLLDHIDNFTNALNNLYKKNCSPALPTTTKKNIRLTDINKKVHTNEISLRFYHIKRMLKSLAVLKSINIQNETPFKFMRSSSTPFIIFDNTVEFEHEHVRHCIETMEETVSIDPLFDLWDDYLQFKHVDDEHFTREFFVAVFITYKNLILNNDLESIKRDSSLSNAVKLYEKINSLATEELLEAIDTVVEIIELSGLRKPLTWRQWSKQYWWVPPTIIGTLAYGYIRKKNQW